MTKNTLKTVTIEATALSFDWHNITHMTQQYIMCYVMIYKSISTFDLALYSELFSL